jgi:hypothetical protein
VLIGGTTESEHVCPVELVGREVVGLLVDDRPVQLAVRTLVEAVKAGEDERCQGLRWTILHRVVRRISLASEIGAARVRRETPLELLRPV